ncbi:transposase [Streptomyces cyaneus]|uniref:transposase n=1 Tax=Streptomyces cyaneus TaxID=1904 RepID=UPI003CCC8D11
MSTEADRRDPLASADPGVPWRDLPVEYGPSQTAPGKFRRWQRTGVRLAVLDLGNQPGA